MILPRIGQAASQQSQATVQLIPSDQLEIVKPIVPHPDDLSPIGAKGTLTIDYVSNLRFKAQAITTKQTVQTLNKRAVVQVSDRRGKSSGWQLTVRPSGLKNDTQSIESQLVWPRTGSLVTTPGNLSVRPQQLSSGRLSDQRDNLLLSAKAGAGNGTWALVLTTATTPVKLTLPAQALTAGKYQGTLIWNLVSGPQ